MVNSNVFRKAASSSGEGWLVGGGRVGVGWWWVLVEGLVGLVMVGWWWDWWEG